MKKAISVFLLTVILITSLFTLSGCAEKKVSDKQIVNDLSTNESITTIFKSELFETKPFEYFSHRITKRQTNLEKKEDIIYCNITVNNTNFSVNADCVLNYNFYDEGGWVLDKIDISNKKATPTDTFSNKEILDAIIKSCTKTEIYLSIEEHGEEAGVNVLKSEIISENTSHTMRVYLKYKRSLAVLEGYMDFAFDNEKGWYFRTGEAVSVTPTKVIEADYQKALGVFSGEKYFDTFELYIDSINEEEGYAEIRIKSIDSYGQSRWKKEGKVMKCPFDIYTGTIDASEEDINYWINFKIFGLTYNSVDDSWDGFPRKK